MDPRSFVTRNHRNASRATNAPRSNRPLRSGSLALWSGNSKAFAAALIHQVPLVLRGLEVFNIDCAMRFNAFLLADEAQRRGVAPEEVLQRVRVQRAFTPYQILDVLHTVQKAPGRSVYFLLAPCKQFFDGDVGHEEAVFLLEKMLAVIRQLRAQAVPLLIVERTEYPHPAFAEVYRRLSILAGVLAHPRTFSLTRPVADRPPWLIVPGARPPCRAVGRAGTLGYGA